jgi:hypothetical protein
MAWLLEVVIQNGLGDQLRLVASTLVQICAAIVSEWVQSCGVLVEGVLMGALVEEGLESGVLLPCLNASNDLSDVVLESGWLATDMRG